MDRRTLVDPNRMVVTLTVGELQGVIEQAVQQALANPPPSKLQFTLPEAAEMLNMKSYLLAEWCRARKVPFHRAGHAYYFTQEDLNAIIEASARGMDHHSPS